MRRDDRTPDLADTELCHYRRWSNMQEHEDCRTSCSTPGASDRLRDPQARLRALFALDTGISTRAPIRTRIGGTSAPANAIICGFMRDRAIARPPRICRTAPRSHADELDGPR